MFRNRKMVVEEKVNGSAMEKELTEDGVGVRALTGGPSPQLKASLISFLTWQWVQPFITIGQKKPLEAVDLYDLIPKETTLQCQTTWMKAVEDEKRKYRKEKAISISVWKLLYRCMGNEFLLSSLCQPIWLTAVVLQVYVLRALVHIVQKNETERLHWWWATILVVAMLVSSETLSISQLMSWTFGQRMGMRARATIAMAVFNKLEDMRLVSLVSTNTGIMLNLVTNDTQKVVDAATYFHFVWFGMVDILVVGGLVLYEAGIAGLPGVALIFLTQPLQVKIAQLVGNLRRIAIVHTDSRVRSANEILTGVRVVKYNGWTAAFLKRIGELRALEMRWIRRAAFLRASTSTLKDGVTPLASLATFGTYVAINGTATMTSTKSFTILALFSILVRLFGIAPAGVQFASEALVAIQRLQKLLDLPNGSGFSSHSETDEVSATKTDAAVVVFDGEFSWILNDGFVDETVKKGILKDERVEKVGDIKAHTLAGQKRQFSDEVADEAARLKGINIEVKRGELVAIVGPVGSGKSSLLLALLGEMECVAGSFKTDRPVAYVPQQPWILNHTIRCNILFGSVYDELRYNEVVTACALDHDIAQLPAGDDTEIGERGVNLSGGQKARISLARACYSKSTLLFLDDPLAAIDVPTAKHLMDHVLAGVIKDRTVILVTHNKTALSFCDRVFMMEHGRLKELPKEVLLAGEVAAILFEEVETSNEDALYEQSICDFSEGIDAGGAMAVASDSIQEATVVHEAVGENQKENSFEGTGIGQKGFGKVAIFHSKSASQSDLVDVCLVERLDKDKAVEAGPDVNKDSAEGAHTPGIEYSKNARGKLTLKEDRVEGVVTWATYIQYAKDGGGLAFFIFVMIVFLCGQAVRVMVDYWLSVWVDGKYHLSTKIYVATYASFSVGAICFSLARALLFTEAAMLSAKEMHGQMAEKVLRSPQLFFDQNPVGRIANRFSKDQAFVDELLPATAQACLENVVGCLGSIAMIAVLVPWFLLCVPPFVLVLLYLQRRFVVVSRELRRLDGVSRSPMYEHFSQTLQGISSVRAFGAERRMCDQFKAMIDANHRAFVLFVHSSRWFGVRLDFAAASCVALTAFLVVLLRHSLRPGLAGVVLVQSLQLTGFFQYGVRLAADTENYFTSVERIQTYVDLPSEADPDTVPGIIGEDWPQKGEIEFVHYTMAYRVDLPAVLNDLSFKVNAQEKVGILGRTGSGKSSLAAAMFRLVENSACSGKILIDGIDITRIGLDDLRRRLSIIPQDPVLFRGTVRLNLDPLEQHTSVEINEALDKVHLSEKIRSLGRGIDSIVAENGDNFSVGQRQLLCLARSLLRRSCIIVMDEATAAVDGDTDQLIQTSMRNVLNNCTVLTIAHRIDTIIDCDRVLVLSTGGRVAEFDTPDNLLRRAEHFSRLNSQGDGHKSNGEGNYGFADIVAQSGTIIAQQLREAAEVAELQKAKRPS